jgi:hypothetical protein
MWSRHPMPLPYDGWAQHIQLVPTSLAENGNDGYPHPTRSHISSSRLNFDGNSRSDVEAQIWRGPSVTITGHTAWQNRWRHFATQVGSGGLKRVLRATFMGRRRENSYRPCKSWKSACWRGDEQVIWLREKILPCPTYTYMDLYTVYAYICCRYIYINWNA